MPGMIMSMPPPPPIIVNHDHESAFVWACNALTFTDKAFISGGSLVGLLIVSAFIVMTFSMMNDESISETTKAEKIAGYLFIAASSIVWIFLLVCMIGIWFQTY